jgi:cation transport ATPase
MYLAMPNTFIRKVSSLARKRGKIRAENASEHPLARAIVAGAQSQSISLPPQESFQAIPGGGVAARIEEHDLVIGTRKLLLERGILLDEVEGSPMCKLMFLLRP